MTSPHATQSAFPSPSSGSSQDSAPQIATFMYHDVTDQPGDSGFSHPGARAYAHSRAEFERHLDELSACGITPELVTSIHPAAGEQHILLSFDDGGRSALHTGDALVRRGWLGHFFIITSRIGSRAFLGASDILYLRSCGHIIGSHSHTHPSIFRDLDSRQMLEEWRVSADILSSLLAERCLIGSVPGGDISKLTLQVGAAAGLRFLFTSEPWLQPRFVDGCTVLGRFCVKGDVTAAAIRELAAMRGWQSVQFERRMKVLASRAFAPLYRLYVRRTTAERAS